MIIFVLTPYKRLVLAVLGAVLHVLLCATSAHADVWGYVDEAGNTHFAQLGALTPGDRITLDTSGGVFVYEMVDAVIISENDEQYVMPTTNEVLTLLTCYPFDFIGETTQRYIVRCRLISGPENAWGGV